MDQEILKSLLKDFIAPSIPGKTMMDIMAAAGDEKVRVENFYSILQGNQAYSQMILNVGFLSTRIAEWVEEDPKRHDKVEVFLDRVLSLLGKVAMRNLVVCLRLNRS